MDDLFSLKETWRNLYLAALEFKKLSPWEWMMDEEIFGVQNPVDQQIGYCCVMGALGEVFALAVYLGSEGLNTYLNIQSGNYLFDELFYSQKCLMASFENRENLNKPDHQMIKDLGFKFRGANAWPLFRSHEPGYHPWYLTLEEVEFLTIALQQTIEVATRIKQNRKLLKSKEKGYYFVRVPEREGDSFTWKDAWLQPESWNPELTIPQPNEIKLQKIRQTITNAGGIWEIDYFYVPMLINDKKRPYYPLVLFAVDHNSGIALTCHLAEKNNYKVEFQENILDLISRLNFLPKKVLVGRNELYKLLEPIKSYFNIEMKMAKNLKMLESVKSSLFDFCLRRRPDF